MRKPQLYIYSKWSVVQRPKFRPTSLNSREERKGQWLLLLGHVHSTEFKIRSCWYLFWTWHKATVWTKFAFFFVTLIFTWTWSSLFLVLKNRIYSVVSFCQLTNFCEELSESLYFPHRTLYDSSLNNIQNILCSNHLKSAHRLISASNSDAKNCRLSHPTKSPLKC